MNCQKCGRVITKEDSFSYEGKILCEDCYMEVGLHPKECDPWATYSATNTPGGTGPKSQLELTDVQKKVLDVIINRRKVARAEIMADFSLSESDIDLQMAPLYHAELVKEISDGGRVYLVPIPAPGR